MENSLERYISFLDAAGIVYERSVPMSARTSFRIGGPADLCVSPESVDAAVEAIKNADLCGVLTMILGNGSNVLFDDAGFRGAVIFTKKLRDVAVCGTHLTAGAGAPLGSVAVAARDAGLTGLEFAYGIPGTLGGALCMNAGAYGGEMADVTESVVLYDRERGCTVTLSGSEMDFGYRKSIVGDGSRYVVLGARLALSVGDKNMISEKMNELMRRRNEKQPLNYPSAGSVFKRSAPDVYVGKMIEESGLMGYSIGGAQVSEKHAGFIINRGNATSADVNALIAYIQNKITEKYGIDLECEIRRIPERK